MKQNVHHGKEYNYIFNEIAMVSCDCHFVDMLPEIKYMLDNELMDEMCLGKYDSCVDEMFAYRESDRNLCKAQINAMEELQSWAMFEQESSPVESKKERKDFEKLIKAMIKSEEKESRKEMA